MIIDLFPKPPESVIQNCLFVFKDIQDPIEPPIFTFEDGGVIRVYLDGYAIVPMEKYVSKEDHEKLVQKYNDLLRKTDDDCPF